MMTSACHNPVMKMMWNRAFGLLLVLLMTVTPLVACKAQQAETQTEVVRIDSAGREKGKLTVEVAIDPRTQERGLMFRKDMPKDAGMIFIFPDNVIAKFWMKNTLLPLDMVFIDQDGRIVKIHENAIPEDETPIYSQFPCRAVLEINGGRAREMRLEVGDLVFSDALDKAVKFGTGAVE